MDITTLVTQFLTKWSPRTPADQAEFLKDFEALTTGIYNHFNNTVKEALLEPKELSDEFTKIDEENPF